MNIKPLFDRVILEKDNNEISKTNIILPTADEEYPIGTVVAVGSGLDFDNNDIGMQVEIGDKVIYSKFAGIDVKFENKNYLVIRQIDIIGKILSEK